jgi:glycerophosphoryl diester phosphodiesterase
MCAFTSHAVEFIAHRGASYDAPENTLAALKLGFEQGADAGELDLYLTADGQIAVLHDSTTARVAGITNEVATTSLEQLQRLEVGQWGKWKGSQFSERIPKLDEALALLPDGKRMFLEVKCGPEVLPALEQALERSGKTRSRTVIIGFGYETMKQAKTRFPDLKVLWLVGRDNKTKSYAPVSDLITMAKDAGLDGLNLEQGFPMDREFVAKVQEAGLSLYTWTVDDPIMARRLRDFGVDGITTNRPQWLREQLAR